VTRRVLARTFSGGKFQLAGLAARPRMHSFGRLWREGSGTAQHVHFHDEQERNGGETPCSSPSSSRGWEALHVRRERPWILPATPRSLRSLSGRRWLSRGTGGTSVSQPPSRHGARVIVRPPVQAGTNVRRNRTSSAQAGRNRALRPHFSRWPCRPPSLLLEPVVPALPPTLHSAYRLFICGPDPL
jgi:hypothetical protein